MAALWDIEFTNSGAKVKFEFLISGKRGNLLRPLGERFARQIPLHVSSNFLNPIKLIRPTRRAIF